jgi:Transposase and inactivated derivatives
VSQSKYDREFKEQIVQRILSGEATITEMARELELHYTTVRDWVRQYKQDGNSAFPGSGNLKDEDAELRKLRKELLDLKEENTILKKAAAYFAKNLK